MTGASFLYLHKYTCVLHITILTEWLPPVGEIRSQTKATEFSLVTYNCLSHELKVIHPNML
jgi:hypothetical protein